MTDFHTHILPGMDDGSKDVSESLELLKIEQEMGIDRIVLTSHFYSDQNSPERFLRRRERAWQQLWPELDDSMPELLLGAEVQYFEGMNHVEMLPDLRIEGTDLLLLEMPFCSWDSRMIRTVLELNDSGYMRVVLAHIDRYLKWQKADTWDALRRNGILMQVNASAFEGFFGKRKAMKMLENNEFQLLGSDCHNLKTRRPNWNLVPDAARAKVERTADYLLSEE